MTIKGRFFGLIQQWRAKRCWQVVKWMTFSFVRGLVICRQTCSTFSTVNWRKKLHISGSSQKRSAIVQGCTRSTLISPALSLVVVKMGRITIHICAGTGTSISDKIRKKCQYHAHISSQATKALGLRYALTCFKDLPMKQFSEVPSVLISRCKKCHSLMKIPCPSSLSILRHSYRIYSCTHGY